MLRESERESERELLVEGGRRTAAADRVGGLCRQAAAPGQVCVTCISRGSTSEAILGLARIVYHVTVGATVGPGRTRRPISGQANNVDASGRPQRMPTNNIGCHKIIIADDLVLSSILAPLPLVPGWSCCSRVDCAVACLQLSSRFCPSLVRFSFSFFLCPPLVPLLFLHPRV